MSPSISAVSSGVAAVIIAASIIIATSALIATSSPLSLVRSFIVVTAFSVCFAALFFVSGLKLCGLARRSIFAEATFKLGYHLLLCDIINVLILLCKIFLVWLAHGEEEYFFLHPVCREFHTSSGVSACGVRI